MLRLCFSTHVPINAIFGLSRQSKFNRHAGTGVKWYRISLLKYYNHMPIAQYVQSTVQVMPLPLWPSNLQRSMDVWLCYHWRVSTSVISKHTLLPRFQFATTSNKQIWCLSRAWCPMYICTSLMNPTLGYSMAPPGLELICSTRIEVVSLCLILPHTWCHIDWQMIPCSVQRLLIPLQGLDCDAV